jgi:hypothetical protein
MFSGQKITYIIKTKNIIIGSDMKYVPANIIPLSLPLYEKVQSEQNVPTES